MITKDKVTEIFCIIDEFDKNLGGELKKNLCLFAHNSSRKCYINRKGRLSETSAKVFLHLKATIDNQWVIFMISLSIWGFAEVSV